MISSVLISAALGLMVLATTDSVYGDECGICGPTISVKLIIQNNLTTPYFNNSIVIANGQQQLIYFLQAAANKQKVFRFSGDYFGEMGYFITTINGLTADWGKNKTSWTITDNYNNRLTQGVSSYLPSNKQTIIFTYTKSSGHN